jgi:hypothetical protein
MRKFHLIFVLASSLLPFATTQAAPADLPQTGQATCYDAVGTIIACATTGQDGDLKAGMAWPNPRFVVGPTTDCVTDTLTGLVWVRAPVYASYSWYTALAYANNLNLCGYTDWRLPNLNELKSMVNSEAANPAAFLNLTAQGFSGIQAAPYWSSTTHAGNLALAWYVFIGGGVDGADKSTLVAFAWPVRAGQ